MIIVSVLAGFPIALILGWAFDVGPGGIEKTPAVDTAEESCPPSFRPRRWNLCILGIIGIALSITAGLLILPRAGRRNLEKSIAVLPFDNFSENKENEHFGDGIQDDRRACECAVDRCGQRRAFCGRRSTALAKSPFQNVRGETSAPLPKSFLAAQIYRAMREVEKARSAYEEALPVAERAASESPGDPVRHVLLGQIYAGLGRKDEALQAGGRAVEILPESKDALDGPIIAIALSRIYNLVGDHEEAITRLEKSLATSGGATVNELRFDPTWDVLRENSRFRKLTAQDSAPRS